MSEFYNIAVKQLGKPYGFGQKWNLDDPDPQGPIDCSGFVRWLIYQATGVEVPDGSYNQLQDCTLLNPQSLAQPMDVGFFKNIEGVHHVGIILDDTYVIEARGIQSDSEGHPEYGKVILRKRTIWQIWREFCGWYRFNELIDGN